MSAFGNEICPFSSGVNIVLQNLEFKKVTYKNKEKKQARGHDYE